MSFKAIVSILCMFCISSPSFGASSGADVLVQGRVKLARFDLDGALTCFEKAAELCKANLSERWKALMASGCLHLDCRDMSSAASDFERALEVARGLKDDSLIAESLCWQALACCLDAREGTALTFVGEASRLLPLPRGPRDEALVSLVNGAVALRNERQPAGMKLLLRASGAANAAGDDALEARAHWLLGMYGSQTGRRVTLLQAMTLAKAVGNGALELLCSIRLAELECEREQYEEALDHLTPRLEVCEAIIASRILFEGRMMEGRSRRKLSRHDAAIRSYEKALLLARVLNDGVASAEAIEPLVVSCQLREDFRKARLYVRQALSVLEGNETAEAVRLRETFKKYAARLAE